MFRSPDRYSVRFILLNREPRFGKGPVTILDLMEQGCSLRGACQKMGMAYSKGWRIIKAAEADLGFCLIETRKGGASRSGSTVTPEGKELLVRYRTFEAEARRELDRIFRRCFPPQSGQTGLE